MHPHRSMEAAAIEDKEQPAAAATSAASHEVRLHIPASAKGPYRLRRRVPQWVRDANKEAYAPKFMCFGPYHHYNRVGLHHEELKGRYAAELLRTPPSPVTRPGATSSGESASRGSEE